MKKISYLIVIVLLLYSCAATSTLTYTRMTAPLSAQAQKCLFSEVSIQKKFDRDSRKDGTTQFRTDINRPGLIGYLELTSTGTTAFYKKGSWPKNDLYFYGGDTFYSKSNSGEVYFEGGYCIWNDKGITIFVEKSQ